MTFDNELKLIGQSGFTEDEIGNQIPVDPIETIVLCGLKSVTRAEHYAAAANGLQPEMLFIVNRYEYDGQKEVEFEGKRYTVIRSYTIDKVKEIGNFENIEIVCQGVV